MSSELAIEVVQLGKCYQIYDKPRDRLLQMLAGGRRQYHRDFWALRDVSFGVGRGETVGIIGRNGSGKSTLLQMVCGTVAPTEGTVQVNGRVAALLELGAGFNPEFTGRENVLLNAAILGVPREVMTERMHAVAAFSELGEFLDQPVKSYSSGMYARLAFSVAIHVDPDIVVVDEALAVGDARFVAKCMRRIRDMQERGATILFVSHDATAVRSLCQRAVWLDQGRLVEVGDVFPVTGRYMEYMFRDEDGSAQTGAEPAGQPAPSMPKLDARPVTHWGSRKGIVRSAAVCDTGGGVREVLQWGEEVQVLIDLEVPPDVPRQHLSVAFSVKDLRGTDLLVASTHEQGVLLPERARMKVAFSFTNLLMSGQYLLVVAVESREFADIHYFEYVEGAHYFSCVATQRSGIFQPEMRQTVEVA